MSPLSVLHLAGSAVDEFHADLSRLYASACVEALADPARYTFHLAYVTPDGRWRFPTAFDDTAIADAADMSLADAVAHLAALQIDVMLPQMFCIPGMTTYRALFDLLGITYLGNRPDVMALTADKAKARAIVAAAGVPVPAGYVVAAGDPLEISVPVIVKPVDADNSLGVSLVRDAADFDVAVKEALTHGSTALVESYVELGREVRCGIVDRGGELVCLPLEEYAVDKATKPIRDRADKLARTDDGDLRLVAKDISHAWIVPENDPITQRVWEAARLCYTALGCRNYGLFDFRVEDEGTPWFLEAGLYCSFAPTSVVAVMAAAAEIDIEDLFATMAAESRTKEVDRWITHF